ncbi:HNH endonuclease [Cytobacillus sp. FJAT-53684]|uniref:HNH endonuclease n=1 Tax=Cytobacillus mangrovibacter TaxID=3299024 RepID=A0ABW6K1A7_9BACI
MREINGYEGFYSINEQGVIRNVRTGKIKKHTLQNSGYMSVSLYKNGHRKTFLVHRLIAETFLPNPNNLKTVNHIDGNKINNDLSNLEWASHSENHLHAYRELGRKTWLEGLYGASNFNSKSVIMFSKNGEFLAEYGALREAERKTGVRENNIRRAIKYKGTAGGYVWKYGGVS